jgi:hypothetical protein
MNKLVAVFALVALLASCAPRVTVTPGNGSVASASLGPALEVRENNRSIDLQCAGRDVVVVGNNNTIRLRGQCGTLTLRGNSNVVQADRLERVIARGNTNRVQWGAGLAKPAIEDSGNNNRMGPG